MAFEIKLHKEVLKFLEKHPEIVEPFDSAMEKIESNPHPMPG